MNLTAGTRLKSQVCSTEVIVVKPPAGDVELSCGGSPMVPVGDEAAAGGSPSAEFSEGTALGKRYESEASGIEVLCTKAGDGSLSLDGEALTQKGAKPLPASD
jgi:hypothetical protein